jgi:hypothetical protein
MAQDNKAFKELVEIGKEHGYLTLDEINKSLTSAASNSFSIWELFAKKNRSKN